jgi:hypothetical protein
MAHYLVKGKFRPDRLPELERRLHAGEFRSLRPFGASLTRGLEGARADPDGVHAVWEEEDYCSPPLAQERAAVLDDYFDELRWERVEMDAGWRRIEALPLLWERR